MSKLLIDNASLVAPGEFRRSGSVLVDAGKIAEIDPDPRTLDPSCQKFDAGGAVLTPGLIDIHTHAIGQYHYEGGPASLLEAAAILPRYGATCAFPTLYALQDATVLEPLEQLASALDRTRGAVLPGLHLEGPFLKLPGAGAATLPGDVGFLEELLGAARGRVAAMSISPDTENILPVIERLRADGVRVFLTHTRASPEQTEAAIAAGAVHATHFYDVFPVPEETDPGVRPVGAVEVVLGDARCSVDFICDGVHVHPAAIRAALAAKGWEKVIAITDANIGAGLPDGRYETPWGYPIEVSRKSAARVASADGAARHPPAGSLAGSALTMDVAMENLHHWLDLESHKICAMGSLNPASLMGLSSKGRLCVGADADLVLWKDSPDAWRVQRTWVAGACVFDADEKHALEDL